MKASASSPVSRHAARAENFGDTDLGAVTFDQFLASVYSPANADLFRRPAARSRVVDSDDIRSEFVLALYRIKFPTDLTPERANHLLRKLAARFVTLRLGDVARRRAIRESTEAKLNIAGAFSARPSPSPASESLLSRVVDALREHPSHVTEALLIAIRCSVRTHGRKVAVAEIQNEMRPREFREAIATARQVVEAKGVLRPV